MAEHNLRHFQPVRRTTGRRVGHLGALAEKRGTDRGGRDYAEGLHLPASIVIEPVNGAARNAERLPGPNLDWFSIDSPGQHSVDAVNRLLVMVVTVRRPHQTLRAGDRKFKGRDAAVRGFARDQEADSERPYMDSLFGRIDVR